MAYYFKSTTKFYLIILYNLLNDKNLPIFSYIQICNKITKKCQTFDRRGEIKLRCQKTTHLALWQHQFNNIYSCTTPLVNAAKSGKSATSYG